MCHSFVLRAWVAELDLLSVEFNNAGCLLISEVKYLLENRDKDAPDTAYVPFECAHASLALLELQRVQ